MRIASRAAGIAIITTGTWTTLAIKLRSGVLKALKSFSERCKDIEFANSQVQYMAERSVGLSMFARAPLIDWVQWEQQFGVLIETKSANQIRPFEERQWIIRQVNKLAVMKKKLATCGR